MKKYLFHYILFFSCLHFKAQTTNQHLLGANIGFFALPETVNSNIDIGGSYVYARKHFYTKIDIGYCPKTNFGNITRFILSGGVTTDINQQISFHVGFLGLSGFTGTKTHLIDSIDYDIVSGGYAGHIGILLQPKFDHKLFIGFDMNIAAYEIYPTGWIEVNKYNQLRKTGVGFLFNLTISYKLNFFRNEKVSIDDPIIPVPK